MIPGGTEITNKKMVKARPNSRLVSIQWVATTASTHHHERHHPKLRDLQWLGPDNQYAPDLAVVGFQEIVNIDAINVAVDNKTQQQSHF